MKILNQSITFLLAISLLVSCNTGEKKSTDNSSKEVDLSAIIKVADAITPEISSIEDVFNTLELTEASYFPMLCNDPYNASNYISDKSDAAANLGIYVTDIVYHKYGDAIEEMFLAFSAAQELAKAMGLESQFGATLLTELEGGNVSRDSLIIVFSGLMSDSEKYNSKAEMMHVHTAFLTGLYVEKIFITSSLLSQAQKKDDASDQEIINYKKLLVVFNNQLESIDLLLPAIKIQAKQLKEVFDTKELQSLKTAASNLDAKSSAILEDATISASPEVTALAEIISNIRTRIVSAS